MFEIIFLGTSASAPSVGRGLSSQMVKHDEYRFLIDCGEGTQRQILTAGIGFKKLNNILITHGHLDHILGLAGLLSTFMRWETIDNLQVFGPRSALERVDDLLTRVVLRGATPPMPLNLIPITPGTFFEADDFSISAFKVIHGASESLGYRFEEKPRRPFLAEKADALGIPSGPVRRELVEGRAVRLAGGRQSEPGDGLGEGRRRARRTDQPVRTVGADQVREGRLDRIVAADERVVIRIRNLGRILRMVALVVVGDLLGEPHQFVGGLSLGKRYNLCHARACATGGRPARASIRRDRQHMHLAPDTKAERFIERDRPRIVGIAVEKGRFAARGHRAHDMADQRARQPAAAAIFPRRDAADLCHARHQHSLPRHREQAAVLANPEEGTVTMRRAAPWAGPGMSGKRRHFGRVGLAERDDRGLAWPRRGRRIFSDHLREPSPHAVGQRSWKIVARRIPARPIMRHDLRSQW